MGDIRSYFHNGRNTSIINLGYATKYSILIQSEQREYILNIIKLITVVFSEILIITVIYLNGHMLLVRFAIMVGAIISSVILPWHAKSTINS